MKLSILFSKGCFVATLLLPGLTTPAVGQSIELMPMFTDHMVLQQKSETAIWGKAAPGAYVTITGSWGKQAKTQANARGEWGTKLKTPSAGGPCQVTIATETDSIVLKDVLIGEVWLCSGQSNMEMPLEGWPPTDPIEGSEETIATANYPNIRMFNVKNSYDTHPQASVEGTWAVCSPETAGNFSAAAFFFARKLFETLNIPIGLIHSSWGGTPAEAWTPLEHLKQIGDFKDVETHLKSAREASERLNAWLQQKESVELDESLGDDRWKRLEFGDAALDGMGHDDSDWPLMQLPTRWEEADLPGFDGVVWFRKHLQIPETWSGKDLVLKLAPIDDMDRTYFNGALIGSRETHGFWQEKRIYDVPANLVHPGEAVIAVRVVDTGGGGGIWGSPEDMSLSPRESPDLAISLAGKWRYLPVAEYDGSKFYLIGTTIADFKNRPKLRSQLNQHTPTVLYNAMIAPLVPYSLKGAIWYQGESNAGRAEQYKQLFPMMIQSWRQAWGAEFPFYFVQIAPFQYSGAENSESAELRNAQNETLKLPQTGQAVTLDIGNVENVHPANKKDVGERLARWALAKDYQQTNVPFSGPVCTAAQVQNQKVVLIFDPGAEALVAGETPLQGFELVLDDGSSAEVDAVIDGEQVLLPVMPGQNPTAVRYAWKNGSTATLFNSAGLPASTFYVLIK